MLRIPGIVALLCGLALLAAEPASAQRRVALVIGNSVYQNAARLPNPTKDADAIGDLFRKAGFETVNVRKDLGQVEFRRALREFQDAAEGADIAVLYYAGHAIQVRDANYMVPIDAKLVAEYDAEDEAVSLDRLLTALDPAKRLRLIILDSCRDNPFLKTIRRKIATRALSTGLAKIVPPGETLVAYAAAAGSTAEDGDGEHSPFTTALLKHIAEPGLDIRLALGRVRDDVKKMTDGRQEPFVYGALGGDNISLVPAPAQPVATMEDVRRDYELVERIDTPKAWEIFINTHKSGLLVDLAKERLAKVAMLKPAEPNSAVRTLPKVEPPAVKEPSTRERREWERIKDSANIDAVRKFIARYPSSPLVENAERLLDVLERAAAEREEKARAEREAARQRLEEERQRADEARRARLEREAAKKREAEEARQRAEAERQRAEREAREKREAEAKAAAERRRAEREAAQAAKAAAESAKKREAEEARQRAEAERQRAEREAREKREAEAKAAAERAQAEREAADKREAERKAAAAKREAEEKAAAAQRDVDHDKADAKRADEQRRREAADQERRRQKAAEERRRERAAEERRREKAAEREEAEERAAKRKQARDAERRKPRREVREERRAPETRRQAREAPRSAPARARAQATYAPRYGGGGGGGGGATFTGVGF